MDKERRKELLRQFKENEQVALLQGLNTDLSNMHELMDFLDDYLSDEGCDHSLRTTLTFLNENNIEVDSTVEWLRRNGGYCDCEVLANVEEKIEDL